MSLQRERKCWNGEEVYHESKYVGTSMARIKNSIDKQKNRNNTQSKAQRKKGSFQKAATQA